jgi:hypothetical protein
MYINRIVIARLNAVAETEATVTARQRAFLHQVRCRATFDTAIPVFIAARRVVAAALYSGRLNFHAACVYAKQAADFYRGFLPPDAAKVCGGVAGDDGFGICAAAVIAACRAIRARKDFADERYASVSLY